MASFGSAARWKGGRRGNVVTRWRTGTQGKRRSTMAVAPSWIGLEVHAGEIASDLREKATRGSARQRLHTARQQRRWSCTSTLATASHRMRSGPESSAGRRGAGLGLRRHHHAGDRDADRIEEGSDRPHRGFAPGVASRVEQARTSSHAVQIAQVAVIPRADKAAAAVREHDRALVLGADPTAPGSLFRLWSAAPANRARTAAGRPPLRSSGRWWAAGLLTRSAAS